MSPFSLSLVRKASKKSLRDFSGLKVKTWPHLHHSGTCVPLTLWGYHVRAGPVTKKYKCARQWDPNRESVWYKTRSLRGLVGKC